MCMPMCSEMSTWRHADIYSGGMLTDRLLCAATHCTLLGRSPTDRTGLCRRELPLCVTSGGPPHSAASPSLAHELW